MKKILKIVLGIIGTIYLAVILFATVCLLCYNQYKVTQINDKTFIIIDDESDKYKDGDLVIFVKNPAKEITAGDEIFFYEVTNGEAKVNVGKVTEAVENSDAEAAFNINGAHLVSNDLVIGKTSTAKVYHNVGKILYVFESQYGFLILVILPALLLFFFAIYRFVKELKAPNTDEEVTQKPAPTVEPLQQVEPAGQEQVAADLQSSAALVEEVKPASPVTEEAMVKPTEQEDTSKAEAAPLPTQEASSEQDDIEYL